MGSAFSSWLAKPFDPSNASAYDWFLLVGFLMVVSVIWRIVLIHVLEGLD